jgi:phosphatidate cytidylyltransferase
VTEASGAAPPGAARTSSGLTTRLLTAAVGIPALLAVILIGGPLYVAVVAIALGIGFFEFARATGLRRDPLGAVALATVVALPVAAAWDQVAIVLILSAGVAGTLVALIAGREAPSSLAPWALALAGTLYVGLLGQHFVGLRRLEDGRSWVLLAVAITFATDTAAYATGRLLGRHKLAPRLSPSKTIEGAVGGLAGGALAALAGVALLDLEPSPLAALAIGVAAAVAAEAGDLAESAIKRAAGVKDMGTIVPGHGGILARLDSLLFVVPLIYYVARLVQR